MKRAKITLISIAVFVIILALIASFYFTISDIARIDFAGLAFQGEIEAKNTQAGSGDAKIAREGEYLALTSTWSGLSSGDYGSSASVSTDVTNIDELLVILDANLYASAPSQSGANSQVTIELQGSQSGFMAHPAYSLGASGATKSEYFEPKIVKIKNNFDGTWSFLESLGVGDIFIVKKTMQLQGNIKMTLRQSSSGSGSYGGSTYGTSTFYNIVRKENAFALCKADKYPYDANKDGVIANDGSECLALETIVLNSEEAIKESYDEKLARITAELEAKNAGLQADIDVLKQQLSQQQSTASTQFLQQQLNQLQEELQAAKSTLADVQAKDKNVIAVIEAQEQFEKPSFIKNLWNKIVSFIKGLFA